MHHYQVDGIDFSYNGDFSGDLIVNDFNSGQKIKLTGHGLLEFIWDCYERPKQISALEKRSLPEHIGFSIGWSHIPVNDPDNL